MKKLHSIIFAFITLTLFSCKDDETEPDTLAPAIVFSTPSADAEFNEGEEITIEAEVTDNLALEEVSLSVISPDGNSRTLLFLSENNLNDSREATVYLPYTPEAGAAGNFIFTIEARDKSGNTSTESITVLVLEADRNAPGISIHTPAAEEEFNPDDAIRLQANVADDSALDEVTVWVTPEGGMQHLVHTVNPDDYSNEGSETKIDETIRLSSGTPLAGSYTLTLRAADEHGNTAEKSNTIYIREVDAHAPAITITNPVDGATYYPNETIALRAEVTDNLALASVTVSLTPPGGKAQLLHTVNPEGFTNNNRKADISEAISFGSAAEAGEYILTLTATDSHDNVAAESVSIYVQETNPNAPAISIHKPTDGTEFSPEDVITLEAHIQDESALASVIIRLSDPAGDTHTLHTLREEAFTNGSQEAHISERVSLGTTAGNYILTIEATDTEGNTSDKSVSVFVRIVDTTAPSIALHDPVAGAVYTTRDAIYIRASVVDESRLDKVSVWLISPDGHSHLAHSANRADFLNDGREAEVEKTISLASGDFAAGTYTIMVRATDENGYTAEESVNVNVREADITAPTIIINSPTAGSTFRRGDEVLIDAIIEDDKALAEIHVKVTLGTMITIHEETITEFDKENYHHVEESSIVPDDAPFGSYKVTITATDAEGNQAVKTLTFQVVE